MHAAHLAVRAAAAKAPGAQAAHMFRVVPEAASEVPAGHEVQLEACEAVWKLPALQLVHVAAPDAAYMPARQAVQLRLPTTGAAKPAAHVEQACVDTTPV